MGEFKSGTWIIGLSLYFFIFYVVVSNVLIGATDFGVDTGSTYVNDVGFTTPTNYSTDTDLSSTDSFKWGNVFNAISFMSGFNAFIDMPTTVYYIFSFLFFWLPSIMLLWSIYMAVPFLH